MRTLKRNQREIYYATLIKGEPVTDEWGNETGEYNMVYSDPLTYQNQRFGGPGGGWKPDSSDRWKTTTGR